MDEQHADGYARLSVFGTASFHFQIHETPMFQDLENKRYQDTLFAVEEIEDIPYANVLGFWSELGDETNVTDKIFRMADAINETPLDLHLDIFRPQDDMLKKHPLVMMVHGGAFYFGSKDDKSISTSPTLIQGRPWRISTSPSTTATIISNGCWAVTKGSIHTTNS